MTDTHPRPVKTIRYLLLGILLCALVGAACFWAGRNTGNSQTTADAVVLENRLQSLSELTTVSYQYTNMAQFQNSSDFYGVTIPFTTKSFILTYDGVIKAGIDLGNTNVSVRGDVVTVFLPAATILSHEIDPESIEVFDEKTSIFNPFTVEDFSSFQADQQAVMEEKALSRGLLEQADLQAESSIGALLRPLLADGAELQFIRWDQ